MPRIPFTLRIDQEERTALEHLSELEGRPINQLLNESIKSYLSQQSPKEASLEASLSALQKYRKRDPGFERAAAKFVDAEVRHQDPLEGKPVEGQFVKPRVVPVPLDKPVKSRHPEYEAVKVFVRCGTHKAAGRKWQDQQDQKGEGGDFSDLVEQLLHGYLEA
jgi:predicted transcriptional regulator